MKSFSPWGPVPIMQGESSGLPSEIGTRIYQAKEGAVFMAITVDIPGIGNATYEHVVFDLNGTLATDGHISETLTIALQELTHYMAVHILTAGTHGGVDIIAGITGITPVIVKTGEDKERYVRHLSKVIAVGNGAIDTYMLNAADLSICVIGEEGAYTKTLMSSDIVVHSGQDAVNLLLKPKRLTATLRL